MCAAELGHSDVVEELLNHGADVDFKDAQIQLNVLNNWCNKWNMKINQKKSQAIHVRNYQKSRCPTPLYCGNDTLDYVDTYRYLGYFCHEHLSPNPTFEATTNAAYRSFGRIVRLFKQMKNTMDIG